MCMQSWADGHAATQFQAACMKWLSSASTGFTNGSKATSIWHVQQSEGQSAQDIQSNCHTMLADIAMTLRPQMSGTM